MKHWNWFNNVIQISCGALCQQRFHESHGLKRSHTAAAKNLMIAMQTQDWHYKFPAPLRLGGFM